MCANSNASTPNVVRWDNGTSFKGIEVITGNSHQVNEKLQELVEGHDVLHHLIVFTYFPDVGNFVVYVPYR